MPATVWPSFLWSVMHAGGCFNKIPPQRQLDIASRKKIIVCEYCGRILVDSKMSEEEV